MLLYPLARGCGTKYVLQVGDPRFIRQHRVGKPNQKLAKDRVNNTELDGSIQLLPIRYTFLSIITHWCRLLVSWTSDPSLEQTPKPKISTFLNIDSYLQRNILDSG